MKNLPGVVLAISILLLVNATGTQKSQARIRPPFSAYHDGDPDEGLCIEGPCNPPPICMPMEPCLKDSRVVSFRR